MLKWNSMTDEQKSDRVHKLHDVRQAMQLESRTKRASKPRKRQLKTTFKSKELQELFNSLPSDMQRLVS